MRRVLDELGGTQGGLRRVVHRNRRLHARVQHPRTHPADVRRQTRRVRRRRRPHLFRIRHLSGGSRSLHRTRLRLLRTQATAPRRPRHVRCSLRRLRARLDPAHARRRSVLPRVLLGSRDAHRPVVRRRHHAERTGGLHHEPVLRLPVRRRRHRSDRRRLLRPARHPNAVVHPLRHDDAVLRDGSAHRRRVRPRRDFSSRTARRRARHRGDTQPPRGRSRGLGRLRTPGNHVVHRRPWLLPLGVQLVFPRLRHVRFSRSPRQRSVSSSPSTWPSAESSRFRSAGWPTTTTTTESTSSSLAGC